MSSQIVLINLLVLKNLFILDCLFKRIPAIEDLWI
jgi:hypothetical protein